MVRWARLFVLLSYSLSPDLCVSAPILSIGLELHHGHWRRIAEGRVTTVCGCRAGDVVQVGGADVRTGAYAVLQ